MPLIDDDLPEIETLDLVGSDPKDPPAEVPEEAPPAEVPVPFTPPPTFGPLDELAGDAREVAEEILTTLPRVKPAEAIAFVRKWLPVFGPDRLYALFWPAVMAGIDTAAGLNTRLQEAKLAESQAPYHKPMAMEALPEVPAGPRGVEVARTFSAIIGRIFREPGFDYEAAIAEARRDLRIGGV